MITPTKTFLFICVFLFLATAGCDKKINQITMQKPPAEMVTKQDGDHDAEDVVCLMPCGLPEHGTSCDPKHYLIHPDNNPLLVGFSNFYDKGTQPCDCWEWSDCIWRAYVKFDFQTFQPNSVVSAILRWNQQAKGGSTGHCENKIFVATEPWGKYKTAGEEIGYTSPAVQLNITAIVRDWVNGTRPNHGIFFVGPNEQLEANTNKECYTQLSKVFLDVTFSEKK